MTWIADHILECAPRRAVLRQTAEGFGLDPDAWTTVTEDVEYAHGPL
ncbi:MAG: hypothetical protein HOV79_34355 [Hamadaea sp.]|nr:hypothetical protein [Hamadaea sp.]